jgi:Putative peptidoglycan binding domain
MRRLPTVAGPALLALALFLPTVAAGERGRFPGFVYTSPEAVHDAQEALVALQYLEEKGHSDGEWDEPTRAAARNFQRDHFLRPDGRLDRDTMALLMSHRPPSGTR